MSKLLSAPHEPDEYFRMALSGRHVERDSQDGLLGPKARPVRAEEMWDCEHDAQQMKYLGEPCRVLLINFTLGRL